jgi:hypothetical protein
MKEKALKAADVTLTLLKQNCIKYIIVVRLKSG